MANLDVFDQIISFVKYLSAEKSSKDAVKGMARASAVSNASLASRARLNVCQFPLLTSSTISVSTYQKTSEILEQLYAQYLKLVVVNQLEVINLEKGDNKLSVVGKVHQNDDAMSTNLDQTRNRILQADISSRFESTEMLKEIREALPFLEVYNFSEYQLKQANNELLKEYSENFNTVNLNQNNVLVEASREEDIKTKYERLEELKAEQRILLEKIEELSKKINNDIVLPNVNKNSLQKDLDATKQRLENVNTEINSLLNIIHTISGKKTLVEQEREDAENAEKGKFRKQFGSVTDFDNAIIRKNNQLEPTILSFTMKYHTKGGSFEDTKIALAVKTITHLIQSDEMCFYVNETLTRNKKFFRAIQVLTGEKEFSLRFLLHLDEAKRDAKADSATVKWWRHLKDRRAASWLKAAKGSDPYVPNATLLMSYEDYEQLKLMYKKDIIRDTKLAWKLTDLLFLMHLVIVNDVNNELMIFNKDTRNWEVYTLDKLQNEISTMNKMANQRSLR